MVIRILGDKEAREKGARCWHPLASLLDASLAQVAGGGALAARWNGARSLGIAGREPAWHAGSDGHQEVFGTQELMGIQVSTWSQNSKCTRSQEVSGTQRAPQR